MNNDKAKAIIPVCKVCGKLCYHNGEGKVEWYNCGSRINCAGLFIQSNECVIYSLTAELQEANTKIEGLIKDGNNLIDEVVRLNALVGQWQRSYKEATDE